MNYNPLVSICIPAYNSARWIEATIKSALAQTWKNKEIIIVDDGSTDNTLKIAKQFESDNLKVISQKNSGACVARNRALTIAQGDYIQWLDSDDLLAHDKIENQLINSEQNPRTRKLFSASWGRFFFRIKKARFNRDPLWQDLSPIIWLTHHMRDGYMMHPAAWLVSRELTNLTGPWDERLKLNQDGEYFCRVIVNSELVEFVSNATSYYRIGNLSSISRNRSQKAIESLNLSVNLCVDHLLNLENNKHARDVSIRFLQKFVSKIYDEDSDVVLSTQKRIIELGGSCDPPSKSWKFLITEKLIGLDTAKYLKKLFWNLEILGKKYWEHLCSIIFRDAT